MDIRVKATHCTQAERMRSGPIKMQLRLIRYNAFHYVFHSLTLCVAVMFFPLFFRCVATVVVMHCNLCSYKSIHVPQFRIEFIEPRWCYTCFVGLLHSCTNTHTHIHRCVCSNTLHPARSSQCLAASLGEENKKKPTTKWNPVIVKQRLDVSVYVWVDTFWLIFLPSSFFFLSLFGLVWLLCVFISCCCVFFSFHFLNIKWNV